MEKKICLKINTNSSEIISKMRDVEAALINLDEKCKDLGECTLTLSIDSGMDEWVE